MLDAYITVASVFTGWAIGFLDGSGSTALFPSKFHAFVLAAAIGALWPVFTIYLLLKR